MVKQAAQGRRQAGEKLKGNGIAAERIGPPKAGLEMSNRERGKGQLNMPGKLPRDIFSGAKKPAPLRSRGAGRLSENRKNRMLPADLPGRYPGTDPGGGHHDSIHRQSVSETFQHLILLYFAVVALPWSSSAAAATEEQGPAEFFLSLRGKRQERRGDCRPGPAQARDQLLEHHVPSRVQTVHHGSCRPRIYGSMNWPDQT